MGKPNQRRNRPPVPLFHATPGSSDSHSFESGVQNPALSSQEPAPLQRTHARFFPQPEDRGARELTDEKPLTRQITAGVLNIQHSEEEGDNTEAEESDSGYDTEEYDYDSEIKSEPEAERAQDQSDQNNRVSVK